MGKNNKKRGRRQPSKPGNSSSSAGEEVQSSSLADWVSALAAKESSSSHTEGATTKEERIAKRAAKKRRREEADGNRRRHRRDASPPEGPSAEDAPNSFAEAQTSSEDYALRRLRNNRLLQSVAAYVREACADATAVAEASSSGKGRSRPYQRAGGGMPQGKPAAAAAYRKLKWDDENLQPRKRDYGGIGLARRTLWLSFDDPSFFPKLEEEFKEHIPGFFGKQKTKAMKRQLNKNMLWRQLADQKKRSAGKMARISCGTNNRNDLNRRVNGKKLSDMSPDERVEAMIKAGMI